MADGKELLIHPVAGLVSIVLYTVVGLGLRRLRLSARPTTTG